MRIVFMGTPEFALPSLSILLENRYEIVGVVTVPDKPAGRGRHILFSPVKNDALARGLAVYQPERLDDPQFLDAIRSLRPDLFAVVAFRILPRVLYSLPRLGSFNLHASLLPKYRGAAPINWAIINGERETGVTTFMLKEKVDTGGIVLQARLPIGPDDTAGDLHDRLAEVGAEIVLHTVRLIDSGKAKPVPQDDSAASPAPKIFPNDCRIDWRKPAVRVHDFIRGLSPKPTAFASHGGTMLKIYRSKQIAEGCRGASGEIVSSDKRLVVATRDGAVEVLELQQQGKKRLSAAEFLRGYRLEKGEMLS